MKQKVKKEIYNKYFNDDYHEIRFSDLPKDIQDSDIIDIRRIEAFYSENNSYDAHTELVIIRERLETDNEYQKRTSYDEHKKERMKKMRYESYLRLKAEFEAYDNISKIYE